MGAACAVTGSGTSIRSPMTIGSHDRSGLSRGFDGRLPHRRLWSDRFVGRERQLEQHRDRAAGRGRRPAQHAHPVRHGRRGPDPPARPRPAAASARWPSRSLPSTASATPATSGVPYAPGHRRPRAISSRRCPTTTLADSRRPDRRRHRPPRARASRPGSRSSSCCPRRPRIAAHGVARGAHVRGRARSARAARASGSRWRCSSRTCTTPTPRPAAWSPSWPASPAGSG